MLTTRNWLASASAWTLLLLLVFIGPGCKQSASTQLIRGERLLKEGRHAEAIELLQSALPSLKSNALAHAWNNLGLAHHATGKMDDAARAYQQAITVDRDFAAPRFNLGCLLLQEQNLPAALNELTTYTVLVPSSGEGWTQLGHALLRARRPDEAERAFQNAIKTKGQTPELLTGLGVAHAQRKRGREAVQRFSEALQKQPTYGPALFNLGAAQQDFFRNHPSALALYRDYLATQPSTAPHVAEIQILASKIESELQPRPTLVFTNSAPPVVAQPRVTNPPPVATIQTQTAPSIETNRAVVVIPEPIVIREREPSPVRSNPPPRVVEKAVEPVTPTPKVDVVQLPREQAPPPTKDVSAPPVLRNETPVASRAQTNQATVAKAQSRPEPPPLITKSLSRPQEDKKGWTEKVNPVNWFKRDNNEKPKQTERPRPGRDIQIAANQKPAERLMNFPEPSAPPPRPRYKYLNPPRPTAGNREAATAKLLGAYEAHRARKWDEALRGYEEAIRLDPSYYEAHLNNAIAAYQARRFDLALQSAERAVAANPEGAAAREQLALSLQNAGFYQDAAEQLAIAVKYEPKNARAHLQLANLLAQELNSPSAARAHYLRVLELEPQHPRATEIRYWLNSNQ